MGRSRVYAYCSNKFIGAHILEAPPDLRRITERGVPQILKGAISNRRRSPYQGKGVFGGTSGSSFTRSTVVIMKFSLALIVLLAQNAVAGPIGSTDEKPRPWGFFVNNTILATTGRESVTYPRYVELQDGTIIATTSFSGHSPAYFPIFSSKDGGASWTYVSKLTDQVNGWGMSAQPALAELTEPIGGYEAGTILGTGNSWSDKGTRIDLYASRDKAKSWEFVRRVAEGGRLITTNGATPIWEPFILYVLLPSISYI